LDKCNEIFKQNGNNKTVLRFGFARRTNDSRIL
jgi:hypothetical protein